MMRWWEAWQRWHRGGARAAMLLTLDGQRSAYGTAAQLHTVAHASLWCVLEGLVWTALRQQKSMTGALQTSWAPTL